MAHHFGRKPYDNGAGNLQWLAFLTAGEGLHNNHHAAPTSATFELHGAVVTVFAVYFTVVVRSFLYMLLPQHL